MQDLLVGIGNPFMKLILRSPLHGLFSKNVMLITYVGRKSGRTYTTPVNYLVQGDVLRTVSFRERTWWRNLRGGSSVILRLQGRDVKGWGRVIEDEQEVVTGLESYLRQVPQYARYLGVELDAAGQPRREDVIEAARPRVLVEVKLER